MEELKPCPFCPDGGHPYTHQRDSWSGFVVKCGDCELSTAEWGEKWAAIKVWNTRPENVYQPPKLTCTNLESAAAETFFKCSNCGCFAYNFFRYGDADHTDKLHFCPNCGAEAVS